MTIDSIVYDIDSGKISSSTPLELSRQIADNRKSTTMAQEQKWEVSRTETHTSNFEYGSGFTIAAGVSVTGT